MSHFYQKEGNKGSAIVFMILAFALLFSTAVFAQTTNFYKENDLDNAEKMDVIRQEANPDTSNLNFVIWFMGIKQDSNTPVGATDKKQFKTSGTASNRLLMKTFLKKALNLERVIT